jgi:UDP-3-O-[3-hydroxymyristoyl] glucosamine N-acyltransferase
MSISHLAVVSKNAKIGPGVTIDPFAIIHGGVTLEPEVIIGAYCEIGVPTPLAKMQRLVIGPRSIIRSHSVFYIGSEFALRFGDGASRGRPRKYKCGERPSDRDVQ